MRYQIILSMCLIGLCRSEIKINPTTQLMLNRLSQIKSMLKSTLEDGVMKDSSDLSKTLKKLSNTYRSSRASKRLGKQAEIERKSVVYDESSAYDLQSNSKEEDMKIKTKRIEPILENDSFDTDIKKKKYRYVKRIPVSSKKKIVEEYNTESSYENDRKDLYKPRKLPSDRYKDMFSDQYSSSYKKKPYAREVRSNERRYEEDEYSEDIPK